MANKKKKYISLKELSEICQLEGIKSRREYINWHELRKPPNIPRYPNRVYKDWPGWNVLLNNNNIFRSRNAHLYVSFKECLLYARRSPISTVTEWKEYKDHPPNIPRCPDLYYRGRGFLGWKHFLGTGTHKSIYKAETARMLEERPILMFVVPPGNPPNVIKAVIYPTVDDCKKYLNNTNSAFLRAFYLEKGYDWKSVVLAYGSDYGNGEYLVNNVNGMLFDIDLEMVR